MTGAGEEFKYEILLREASENQTAVGNVCDALAKQRGGDRDPWASFAVASDHRWRGMEPQKGSRIRRDPRRWRAMLALWP